MRSHIKIGRVFGIEIGIHYSWFIIAFLIAFSLEQQFRASNRGWSPGLTWGAAILTAVLFFLCLLAHELSHSLVARAHKLPVREITLFALGGVSVIEKESPSARSEFLIAIVGPLTSFGLGAAMLGIARGLGGTGVLGGTRASSPGVGILLWLGEINLMLGGFNMLPGFPLDGGRVFRAIVWWITGNMERATVIASRVGQGMAVLFIGGGIYSFFRGGGPNGLWLVFIGWFLMQAASANYMEVELKHVLAGLHASDLMSRECAQVPGYISVQEFVDNFLLRSGARCYFVNVQERIAGLVTSHEVRMLDRNEWSITPVQQIMKPLEKLHAVAPETGVLEALEVMAKEDLNQLPVVSDHHVEGMISRSNILEALRSRRELMGGKQRS